VEYHKGVTKIFTKMDDCALTGFNVSTSLQYARLVTLRLLPHLRSVRVRMSSPSSSRSSKSSRLIEQRDIPRMPVDRSRETAARAINRYCFSA